MSAEIDPIALARELIRCLSVAPADEEASGLAGATMHKADERVPVSDVRMLTDIHTAVLHGYFADRRIS